MPQFVVVPKAVEIFGVVPPDESMGYVAVTAVIEPPDVPQSEPVPDTRPDEFTCKHCVEPVIPERVRSANELPVDVAV